MLGVKLPGKFCLEIEYRIAGNDQCLARECADVAGEEEAEFPKRASAFPMYN